MAAIANKKFRVLIVDDSAFMRKVLETILNADDQLLAQLAFAVGQSQGQEIVALRVRPGRKQSPPVVQLDAQEYRHLFHSVGEGAAVVVGGE